LTDKRVEVGRTVVEKFFPQRVNKLLNGFEVERSVGVGWKYVWGNYQLF
jgi:hypothetical protein